MMARNAGSILIPRDSQNRDSQNQDSQNVNVIQSNVTVKEPEWSFIIGVSRTRRHDS